MLKKIALSILLSQTSVSFAQTVQLDELYQRYVEADYSSLELPEYNNEVDFKAVVAALDENMEGGVLAELSSPNDPETALTRATPADRAAAKFSQLKEGQTVQVKCTV